MKVLHEHSCATRQSNPYSINAPKKLPTSLIPPAALADGALTTVAAKICRAGDPPTEKNCLNPSKPEYSVYIECLKNPS